MDALRQSVEASGAATSLCPSDTRGASYDTSVLARVSKGFADLIEPRPQERRRVADLRHARLA